ncbi:hypothetical protein ACLB1G_24295 [Oxalobacteraceae bacterium A2-2]
MSWQLRYTRQAQKDASKLAAAGLKETGASPAGHPGKQPVHIAAAF